MLKFAISLLFSLLLLSACTSKNEEGKSTEKNIGEPLFVRLDPTRTGIQFRNDLKEDVNTKENVLSYQYFFNGGGVAIGDINKDGLEDIFFTGNQVPNKLYLNKGGMRFEDISEKAGIKKKNWSTGVTMADVNNDGWLDIYVCQAGPAGNARKRENLLYINQRDGTFREMAKDYGVNDGNRSTQASFFDYDKDGDLDLYVMNESKYFFVPLNQVFDDLKDSRKMEAASGRLYRNDGDGHFSDVTRQAGLLRYGYGLGLLTTDINQDGWVDIYVANDFSVPDFLFINNGDGTFSEMQKKMTKQVSWFGMGADIADINNDGYPEIGVVDMAAADHIRSKTLMASMSNERFRTMVEYLGYQYQYMFNSLQLNEGPVPGDPKRMIFSNIALRAGVAKTDWSWSALFADFDNDGWKDYFISNGYVRYSLDNDFQNKLKETARKYHGRIPAGIKEELYKEMPSEKLPNILFRNDGALNFNNISEEAGLGEPTFSNGAAYTDLDNDGDLDLVINNIDDPAFVYENTASGRGNHFVQFLFEGGGRNANNMNARIELFGPAGKQTLENTATRGYQSAMGEKLHFGLGKNPKIDSFHVIWPDASMLSVLHPEPDKVYRISRTEARENTTEAVQKDFPVKALDAKALGINFKHHENPFDDFEREILLPHRQSTLGPFLSAADVNGDGLTDFFIGGASGQPGALYLQLRNGHFKEIENAPWTADRASEDMRSVFFDADGDNDPDLYVVSGGNEFPEGDPLYRDRLYLNDGKGHFVKASRSLPDLAISGLAVSAHDIDADGDVDLVVGGRNIPGHYPRAPRSVILINDGKGSFKDKSDEIAPELNGVGLVNDIAWMDLDGDGDEDMLLCGEWMPILAFINDQGHFKIADNHYPFQAFSGWWYRLLIHDVNGDGLPDILAGNVGENNKFHPEPEHPLHIFSDDFDGNGSNDIVLSSKYRGELVPLRGRQCSSEQMPFIKQKFPSYRSFAEADIEDIFGSEKLSKAYHRKADNFSSLYFLNTGKGFSSARYFPPLAQLFPVNAMLAIDVNADGIRDLLMAGNMFGAEVETPRYDAGNGLVLFSHPDSLRSGLPSATGFYAPGDVKDMLTISRADGRSKYIIVGVNNQAPLLFQVEGSRGNRKLTSMEIH